MKGIQSINRLSFNGHNLRFVRNVMKKQYLASELLFFNNIIGERWQFSVVPLSPEKSDSTDWSSYEKYPFYGMGAYGYATSGGTFFDTRSSPTGDVAWNNEIETLDTCMGHSNQALQYHYHGVS